MVSLEWTRPAQAALPRPLQVLTAFSCALLALSGAWALVDTRQLAGVVVWAKPMKFALSFVVLFGTLALVETRLSPAWRDGRMLRVATVAMGGAMMLEMGYMTVMAAAARPSHFNLSSPFTAFMYQMMGVGAFLLILGIALFGIAALRDREADLPPALRWGIGWGFLLTFALTLVTAGVMSAIGTHVGTPAAGAPVLPPLGWSASVGDLRPAHFLSLHAMQALPLVGLWFDRRGIPARRMRWVALGYGVLTLAVFAQALAGLPLLRI